MANLTHGMNIAAVRTSMTKVMTLAQQIEQAKSQLEKEVNGLLSIWSGQDAQKFVNTWPSYNSSLAQIIESLRQLATTGKNQATQQEQTSAS